MSKKICRIDNGVLLISHQLCHLHSVTVSVGFRIGSLYENNYNSGITHFLEHLLFRHLHDLTQSELYLKMQMLGAEIVGKTYSDLMSFEITVVPEFFADALNIMLKYFMEVQWTATEFNDELSVVMRQIENHSQSYREWLDDSYFSNNAYSQSIMGDSEALNNLSIQDLYRWKRLYLVPANSCVIITGCIDEIAIEYAKAQLMSLTPSGKSNQPALCLPDNFGRRTLENDCDIIPCDESISDVTIFFDVPAELDYETVKLLSSILAEGCGSKLGIELREKAAFTDDIYAELVSFYGFSRLSISFDVNGADFEKCINTTFQAISSLCKEIKEEEMISSIIFFTKNQLMDLDDSISLNRNYMISDFSLDRNIISNPIDRKAKYESLDRIKLLECANKLLISSNLSFLIETNLDSGFVKKIIERSILKYL